MINGREARKNRGGKERGREKKRGMDAGWRAG